MNQIGGRRSRTEQLADALRAEAIHVLLRNDSATRQQHILSPGVAGVDNALHLYVLSATGRPKAIPDVAATFSSPANHVGPHEVPLTIAGIGHYRARDVTFGTAGTWVLVVTVRTTPTDERRTRLFVPVR